jgi:hypothetical protein
MRAASSDGVARDEAAHVIAAVERDRRPEIERGAVAQEILRHVLTHAPEAGGPAEHADLAVIALAVDVGARLDQQLDHVEVGNRCGEVKGAGVVGEVADAHVGAALEQQPHAVMPVGAGRAVQRRLLLEPAAAGVDQIGMRVEQSAKIIRPALIGGRENGVDRLPYLRRPPLGALDVAGEKLDRFVPLGLGDLVNGAAVVVGGVGVEARLEGATNRLDIAGARGVEDMLALASRRIELVDMRLELTPTGEAIFARERELGGGELGLRALPAQRLEPLLGFVLEVLEARAFGQSAGAMRGRTRIVGHGKPSFRRRPVSASIGQEVRLCPTAVLRRAEPFTRTVGLRYGR